MQFTALYLMATNSVGEFAGFWTGKAGEAWVSEDPADAYRVGPEEANHKIELFNRRTSLTGLEFQLST